MGASIAKLTPDQEDAFIRLTRVSGGGDYVLGGFDSLDSYKGGAMSAAKRQLVKDIAETLSDKLKIPGLKTKGKKTDDIIAELKKHVPDPRGGATLSDKSKTQKRVCQIIGETVNKKFDDDIVNLSSSPAEICHQVSELMYGIMTGMSEEITFVKKDVDRVLSNLDALQKMVDTTHNSMIGKLNQLQKEDDSSAASATAALNKFHKDLLGEMARQRTILKSMLGNVKPSPRFDEIEDILKRGRETKELVKKIKAGPGTAAFGEKMAYMLTGIRDTAEAANAVDKALKELGVSKAEYAKAGKRKDLQVLLGKKIAEKLNSDEESLSKYLKAAKAVEKQQYKHDEIVKKLGACEDSLQKTEGGAEAVSGGAKLDKRIKQREQTRRDLLKVFNSQLEGLYKTMSLSIKGVSMAVSAKKLDLSDELESFIRALESLPDIGKKYTYLSLTGYINDSQAKQERERFISGAKHMIKVCDDLLKHSEFKGIEHFKDLRKSLESMVSLVETFHKKFAEGFGPYDFTYGARVKGGAGKKKPKKPKGKKKPKKASKKPKKASKKPKKKKGGDDEERGDNIEDSEMDVEEDSMDVEEDSMEVEGGSEESLFPTEGAGFDEEEMKYGKTINMAEINRIAYDFTQAKTDMLYKFRVAKMRDSMAKMQPELKHYGEKYEKVLGDAVAKALDETNKELADAKAKFANVTYTAPDPKGEGYKAVKDYLNAAAAAAGGAAVSDDEVNKKVKEIMRVISKQSESKTDMYRIAEVMDLYMKSFAEGLTANPDDLQDIMAILNKTEVLSRWYNESTGDELTKAFDTFPAMKNIVGENTPTKLPENTEKKHYYEKVREICFVKKSNPVGTAGTVGLPGNPFVSIPVYKQQDDEQGDIYKFMKHLDNALEVNVLKNIIQSFIAIGDKFGGESLSKKMAMSPINIYKKLVEYLKMSSFSVGFKNHEEKIKYSTNIPNIVSSNVYYPNSGKVKIGSVDNEKHFSAVMRHVVLPNNAGAGPLDAFDKDIFKDTDELFVMTIKAMVAKILTCISTYTVLNRPYNDNGLGFYSGLRFAIGAAEDSVPKVIPEATELYIRLPMLVEFYREILDFDNDVEDGYDSKQKLEINMLPEMSGQFGGLVKVLFDRASYVKNGHYSDVDVQIMVEEINKIWNLHKNSKTAVSDVLHEFINEVNRRIGIISEEERKTYQEEKTSLRSTGQYRNPEEIVDFELSGLDEDDDYERPTPSASYQTYTVGDVTPGEAHKYELPIGDSRAKADYLQRLRMRVEYYFDKHRSPDSSKDFPEKMGALSFSEAVRSQRREIESASTDVAKFKAVMNAINGFGENSMSAIDNTLVLFHETVVAGLNTLNAMYSVVNGFAKDIEKMYFEVLDSSNPPTNNELQDVFLFLFTNIFTQASNGLIDVDITASSPGEDLVCPLTVNLGYNKLVDSVREMVNHTKNQIEKFRGLVPESIIKKYEDYGSNGTIYKLEKEFLNELLLGKTESGDSKPIGALNTYVKDILDRLRKSGDIFNDRAYESVGIGISTTNFLLLVDTIRGPDQQQVNPTSVFQVLLNQTGKKMYGVNEGELWQKDLVLATHIYGNQTKTYIGWTQGGVVSLFNRFVKAYLQQFFDANLKRMYLPLLDAFGNGAFNESVYGDKNFSDALMVNNFRKLIPGTPIGGVLSRTLASVIKHLLSDTKIKGEKLYMEEDLSEISLYMKEKFRSQLPVFVKLFNILIERCLMLKKYTQGVSTASPGITNKASKQDIDAILDQVISGSRALVKCASEVIEEMNADHKAFELSLNFIQEYEAVNKKKPFMPPSILQSVLRGDVSFIYPFAETGSDDYKLLYGSREILINGGGLKSYPGMKDILDDHNNLVETRYKMESSDVDKFLEKNTELLDFITEYCYYRANLMTTGSRKIDLLASLEEDEPNSIKSYSTRSTLNMADIVQLVESSQPKDQKYKIVRWVKSGNQCGIGMSRSQILAQNVVDMNIVPLNIHAMMREIPLVNLLNYSFTFDRITMDLYGLDSDNVDHWQKWMRNNTFSITEKVIRGFTNTGKKSDQTGSKNPGSLTRLKRLMGLMLLFPHERVDDEVYETYLPRIFTGDMGIPSLGRPKYISDQLYNKLLFGEMYPAVALEDEAGPARGQAMRDGRINPDPEYKFTLSGIKRIVKVFMSLSFMIDNSVIRGRSRLFEGGSLSLNDLEIKELTQLIDNGIFMLEKSNGQRNFDKNLYKYVEYLSKSKIFGENGSRPTFKKGVSSIYADDVDSYRYWVFISCLIYSLDIVNKNVKWDGKGAKKWIESFSRMTTDSYRAGMRYTESLETTGSNVDVTINHLLQTAMPANLPQTISWNGINFTTNFIPERTKSAMPNFMNYIYSIIDSTPAETQTNPSNYPQSTDLTYIDDKGKVQSVTLSKDTKEILHLIGRMRFDTKLVRNLFWLTNIFRTLRLKLRHELTWYDSKVVDSHATLAPSITEFYGNDSDKSMKLNHYMY